MINKLLIVGIGLATSTLAHGATIMESFTLSPTSIVSGQTTPGTFPYTFFDEAVDQFDPSLGTLNSITIEVTINFLISGETTTGGSVSTDFSGDYYANGSAIDAGVVAGASGNGTGGPPGVFPSVPFTLLTSNTLNPTDHSAYFTRATGTGTYDLSYEGNVNFNIAGASTGNLDITGGSVSVIYDYTSVPEPSAALFGILALSGVALRRRR